MRGFPSLLLCFITYLNISAQVIKAGGVNQAEDSVTRHLTIPIHGIGALSEKYDFTVVLLDNSIIEQSGRINIYNAVHSITFKVGDARVAFKPSDTKLLYRITPEGIKVVGIPTNTCWIFKTESGKVNFYSYIAELKTEYVAAVQVNDDGPLVPLTKENVMEIVKEYPNLIRQVEKGNLLKALRKMNKLFTPDI